MNAATNVKQIQGNHTPITMLVGFVALAAVDLAIGETGAARLAGCPTAARIAGRAGPWATGPVRFA